VKLTSVLLSKSFTPVAAQISPSTAGCEELASSAISFAGKVASNFST
jgi:hypothetical protein